MDAEARQFVAERFDWLTDYRLKLLKLDDDARFYISLVDVRTAQSDQTAMASHHG